MKILIVCVTYNSYESLHSYLESVERAAKNSNDDVSVFVADNSDEKLIEKQEKEFPTIKVKYFNYPNIGYFGGALSVINEINNPLNFKYVMITNVDLLLSGDFFIELKKIEEKDSVGWLVPDIISLSTKTHHNPYRLNRISKTSLDILAFFYKHPFLLFLYQYSIHCLKAKKREKDIKRREIYAGHGSCFIFSSKFIKDRKFKDYPCFLFGEEIFIAEELNKINMTTWYEPSIKVYDFDHISTSKMKKKSYYDANLKAVNFLRKTYFSNKNN